MIVAVTVGGFFSFQQSLLAQQLDVTPKNVLTEEDKEFLFQYKPPKNGNLKIPDKLSLMQLDDSGKTLYRWEMADNGMYGDKAAGDGIYERTVALKERKPGKLYFAVDRNPKQIISISVEPRPTFIQLVCKAFAKFRGK